MNRRLQEHDTAADSSCYTATRRPLELVFHEMFFDPNEAIRREKQLKKWSQAKKHALISGDWDQLRGLSKGKNSQLEPPNVFKEFE